MAARRITEDEEHSYLWATSKKGNVSKNRCLLEGGEWEGDVVEIGSSVHMQRMSMSNHQLGAPTAVLLNAALTLVFFGSFYVLEKPAGASRDDPRVVRRRFMAVLGTCGLAAVVSIFHILSLRTNGLPAAIVLPLILTAVLFAGPLTVEWMSLTPLSLGGGLRKAISVGHRIKRYMQDIIVWRNYVVGPVTEEFVFRGCMLPLFHAAGISSVTSIFTLPLFFGLAHLHHAYDNYKRMGGDREAFWNAAISAAFQFCYTTLFGWFATFLLVRTGHLIAPVVSHMFCNVMGFPDVHAINDHPRHRRKPLIASYFVGMLLFARALFPATDPTLYS
ncbi:CAAX protease self-immunity-domain-containing protein [Powellomyces hirtus]|nr:CAAX protease self-immunity-domain-containing protein [Powellomyces hirtus]